MEYGTDGKPQKRSTMRRKKRGTLLPLPSSHTITCNGITCNGIACNGIAFIHAPASSLYPTTDRPCTMPRVERPCQRGGEEGEHFEERSGGDGLVKGDAKRGYMLASSEKHS
eukprot:TRINITY_DN1542_c0_g1_i1.p1 TRINITY_DN1542_c0_g1~~TRINITY_DN1542_c0_g1_i1.p1  ORF type:complete len:112 (-),score=10.74 TRINITY_DN1542_c0_g1_i1:98-433(-)